MPFSPLYLLVLILLFGFLLAFIQVGLLTIAFDKLGLSPDSGLLLLFSALFGSLVNLPVVRSQRRGTANAATTVDRSAARVATALCRHHADCRQCRRLHHPDIVLAISAAAHAATAVRRRCRDHRRRRGELSHQSTHPASRHCHAATYGAADVDGLFKTAPNPARESLLGGSCIACVQCRYCSLVLFLTTCSANSISACSSVTSPGICWISENRIVAAQ